MARIGVNALYLIPGGVGGTEIYLRELLAALARDRPAQRVFRLHESRDRRRSGRRSKPIFTGSRRPCARASGPARILWEQIVLPLEAVALPAGRAVQSRIHGADSGAVPVRHRVSRSAA